MAFVILSVCVQQEYARPMRECLIFLKSSTMFHVSVRLFSMKMLSNFLIGASTSMEET